jgi:hypothetical protein
MNRYLGLKPQAESCSPFGTKSDTSLGDKARQRPPDAGLRWCLTVRRQRLSFPLLARAGFFVRPLLGFRRTKNS